MSNRYITESIADDLVMGKNVILVSPWRTENQYVFKEVQRLIPAERIAKVRPTSGRESIELTNGGRLRIAPATTTALRGFSADTVVVLGWRELPGDVQQSIIPVVASNGELIRL